MKPLVLTSVIADDERLAREKLRRALQEIHEPRVRILAEAKNGPEALEAIDQLHPDFAVLDIQMPGLSGLDVARHINSPTSVIFATAFDQFALRAFEVNAVDYLLKPYDRQRLLEAILRITDRRSKPQDDQIRGVVRSVLAAGSLSTLERLPARTGHRIKLIDIGTVLWFDTQDSITFAHTGSPSAFDVKYSLDELESRLDSDIFFRIHRSSIVNILQISEIVTWFNGQFKLKMKGQSAAELTVSRNRTAEFRAKLNL